MFSSGSVSGEDRHQEPTAAWQLAHTAMYAANELSARKDLLGFDHSRQPAITHRLHRQSHAGSHRYKLHVFHVLKHWWHFDILRPGTDLVSLCILSLFFLYLLGWQSSKNPEAPSFQIGFGSNLSGLFHTQMLIDWWCWSSYRTSYFQDGGLDFISRKSAKAPLN